MEEAIVGAKKEMGISILPRKNARRRCYTGSIKKYCACICDSFVIDTVALM